MTVVTRTPSQDGHFIAAGWDDAADGIILSVAPAIPSTIGLTFNWGLTFSGTLPLDPPIVSALTLTLTGHPAMAADPGADTVELWAVPTSAPADYSTPLFPFNRSEVLIGAGAFAWTGVGTTVAVTAGTYLTAGNASTPTCRDNWQTIRALYLSSSQWNGKLGLSLRNLGAGISLTFNSLESVGTEPRLASTETSFFTGLVSGESGSRRRYVRDGRFGMPALNTELVRDGDQPGLWVRPEDQDPFDEPAQYKPRRGEGTVDDGMKDM